MSMHRLIYRSESVITGRVADIDAEMQRIADRAARANAAAGVTGAMMRLSGQIFQVLEGPSDAVEAIFERICCDQRHVRLQLLEFSQIRERAFGNWQMALVHAPASGPTANRSLRLVGSQTPAAAHVLDIILGFARGSAKT